MFAQREKSTEIAEKIFVEEISVKLILNICRKLGENTDPRLFRQGLITIFGPLEFEVFLDFRLEILIDLWTVVKFRQ